MKLRYPCFLVGILLLLAACQTEPGLLRPNSAAQASDGSLYVMDNGNHRIVKFDSSGKKQAIFGRLGDKPDQLYRSWDLTIGPDGNIYLCNFHEDDIRVQHDEVKVFSPSGKFIKEIGRVDYLADSDVTPNKPYGIEFDQYGNLFVADYGTGMTRVFNPQGELLTTLFTDLAEGLKYQGLNDIAVDDTSGFLYAVDFALIRLDQFQLTYDAAGVPTATFIRTLATYGRESKAMAFAQYLAVDDETGNIYVGDTGNRRVQVFNSQGEHVSTIKTPDVNEWQIVGISLGKDGTVFVTDAFNNVIWVFSRDGALQNRIEVVR
jgi:DNA-binding beta-propeller fold protein YncE